MMHLGKKKKNKSRHEKVKVLGRGKSGKQWRTWKSLHWGADHGMGSGIKALLSCCCKACVSKPGKKKATMK